MTLPGEDGQGWERARLISIAKDDYLLASFQTLKYINIALLTILLYDHCLTFNLERRRIWTLRWKLPKFLFMFNRYILPPVFLFEGFSNSMRVGQQICDARIYTPIPMCAAIMTVELMLILRVLALYGNSSGLARYLVIQLLAHWIIGGSFFAGFILSRTRSIVGHNLFTGCLYDIPDWASLAWVPLLVAETILAILAIYKCRKYGEFSPTIKILARDSAIYFISIFTVVLFNMWYSYRYKLISMTLSLPTSILTSIAASRLSMNIRAITVERGIATLTYQSRLSTILSFSRHRSGDPDGAGAEARGVDTDEISSPTGVPTRQEGEELEGGYFDDEDNDAWFEERDDDDVEEMKEEDRSMTRREIASNV